MATIESMLNGQFTSNISVLDRGLNYGDGLFETLAVVDQKPVMLDEHISRLFNGCEILHINRPDKEKLYSDILKICKESFIKVTSKNEKNTAQMTDCKKNLVLKIIVTRGIGERGYSFSDEMTANTILITSTYPHYHTDNWLTGIKARICDIQLSPQTKLAGLKHLNRLEQILARNEWNDEFAEGLMTDTQGNLIDGVMTNIFLIKDNTLYTPKIDKCGVNGIMRQLVLKLCHSEGMIVEETNIPLDMLESADEVFVTNSLIGIWPLKSVDTIKFEKGKVTRSIMQKLTTECSIDYATLCL